AAKPRASQKTTSRSEPKSQSALYTPTAKECAAAGRLLERRKTSKPRLDFSVDHSQGGNTIAEVHPDPVIAQISLLDVFGTANTHFSQALLLQVAGISGTPGQNDVRGDKLSHAVAMVQEIGPRDPVEAMMATQ